MDKQAPARQGHRGGIPPAAWRIALALFAAVASTNILTPLLPDVREEFGISLTTAGLVVGVFGMARLIVDLPAGALAQRFGTGRSSLVGCGLIVIGSVLGALAPDVERLLLSRVLAGAGVAIVAMVGLRGMSDVAPEGQRGKVMSLVHVANNSAIAIYPLIGGAVGLLVGWRATFVLTAVLAVLCLVVLIPVVGSASAGRSTRDGHSGPDEPGVGGGRALAVIYVGVVANHIHRHGFRNTFIPLFASASLGLGPGTIAISIALMAGVGLLVASPGGVVSDRYGRRRVIVAGLIGLAITVLLYLGTSGVMSFLLVAVLVGAMDFFSSSQTALITDLTAGEARTRALSRYRFAVDLGAMVGPILLAATFDLWGATATIGLTSLILGVAAAAARFALPAGVRQRGHSHGLG